MEQGRETLTERRTGRTTKQMQEAPPGAIFVWCNGHLWYPRQLARRLGREDLRIIGPHQISPALAGVCPAVVLDHACPRMPENWRDLIYAAGVRTAAP
jgi:hypothetical protein